ncbi:MAG: archaea-specific SMC-related protein [Haloarcula sp.]
MGDAGARDDTVHLDVTNIGGIGSESLQISTGITALVGENATNRTSLVRAIAAGLGTDEYALKSDADTGTVSLTIDEETYERTLSRENGTVRTSGDPYLQEPTIAELYAVLLRSNDIRQAVRDGGDLRPLILEPLDTEEIAARIADRVDERRQVDRELDRLATLEDELDDLRAERRACRERLSELEEELERKREELDAADDHGKPESGGETELDARLAELRETRSELERVTANLESERKRLDSLRESRETLSEQFDSLAVPDEKRVTTLEERVDRLRQQKRSVASTITELQQVIRFNSDRVDGSDAVVTEALEEGDDEPVTAQLDPSQSAVTCWTCGSRVDRSNIETMVDRLKELRREKTAEKNDLADEIDHLTQELETLTTRKEEYETLRSKLDDLEQRIEQTGDTVEQFDRRKESLEEDIERLEAEVESLQESQQDELLGLQQEVSELQFEKEQVQRKVESTESRIEELEAELDSRTELRERRDALSEELEELRTRVERREAAAVEEFNTHMDRLVDELGYDNIERIWLERTETEITDGRQNVTESRFELHVVRTDSDGRGYEDSIDTLSESEREIVGLVVALAGYIVHDVHEKVPFMLLDSVEMIDGERLVDLVSYLESFVPYLVVVLLPDHARAFERRAVGDLTTVQV